MNQTTTAMDEEKRGADPLEPEGIVFSDPGSEGSTGERGQYPDTGGSGDRTCETCSRTVPPDQRQCEFCADESIQSSRPSAATSGTEDSWSFGRVVLAVVPGATEYIGLALGTAAFSLASTSEVVADEEVQDAAVKPVAEFETEPARQLTDGWGDLVEVATVDSDAGRRLFETAVEYTRWEDQHSDGYLYTEEGDPVRTEDELAALREQMSGSAEQWWVVPGVVKRYTSTLNEGIPDAPTQLLQCEECRIETDHRYSGKSVGTPRNRGWPVWLCTDCHEPRFGQEPQEYESPTVIEDIGEYQLGSPRHLHDRAMSNYYETHGQYPWY